MNNVKEIRQIEDKIKEEFKILSESLFRASQIMESLPNQSITPSPPITQLLNNSSEKETKESEEPTLLQKKRKRKNTSAYGKIYKIFCKECLLKDSKKVYTLNVNYQSKKYIIGPYLNLDFVNSIKGDMIKCLNSIPEKESLEKIDKCLDELKKTLYNKYPPLEEDNIDKNK